MALSVQNSDSLKLNERFRETFELAALAMANVALDGSFLFVNQKFSEITGYSNDELTKLRYQDITHKDDLTQDNFYVEKLISGIADSYNFEKRYIHKLGHPVWINLFVSVVRDQNHTPKYFVAIAKDITERISRELENVQVKHQLEEEVVNRTLELSKAKRDLDRFFHMSIDYFMIASKDGYFKVVNDAFVAGLGYSREELTSQPFENFVLEEDRSATAKTAAELRSGVPIFNFENRYRAKDGKIHWLSWRAFPVQEEDAIYAVARDVTELKEKEQLIAEQNAVVVEAARLNSLGQMAAGIAHEINNPLSVFYLNTLYLRELAESGKFSSKEVSETLHKMEEMTWRMNSIIKGLKTFARDGADDPFEAVSVKEIIDSSITLVEFFCNRAAVNLEVEQVPEELFVSARAVQISQILVNLISNAVDAVRDLSERWIKVSVHSENQNLQVKITDSGTGIDPKIQTKIFDPFFTTKPVGKGTGLGLSISHGIARAHGGNLFYDGTAQNTCFILSLPLLIERS